MLEVVNARYEGGYTVWVEFNDGAAGLVDLSDVLWGPMFDPLKDQNRFRRFEVSPIFHTLVWDNDADLAPEYLRERLLHQSVASTSSSLNQ
jgi:hypothetical protein